MYKSFYNLSEMPFTISTDPRFLWLGEKYREALANLKYGLLEANGYVVITGDVGVGKTTLVNALLDDVDDSILKVNISHPTLSTKEFFRFLARTWDGPAELTDKTEFLFFFKEFLLKAHAEGKTILLIIDEAHRLSKKLLEEIRLLSNMEHQGTRLINIFFVGQNELKETLMTPQFRALRQRITLFYDIKPLSPIEIVAYIKHRLQVAGGDINIFSEEAITRIHEFSRGYPRLINTLCGRAMLTGYIKDKHKIDAAIVAECGKELDFLDPSIAQLHSAAGHAATVPVSTHVSSSSEQYVSAKVFMQDEGGREPPPKILKIKVAMEEKIKGLLQNKSEFFSDWRSWLTLPHGSGKVLVFLILVGIMSFFLLSDRNGSFANLEMENEKVAEITASQNKTEPSPPPAAPTTLELASAALEKQSYQVVIDLLGAENNQLDRQPGDYAELYASALVGKAEQIISASPDEAKVLLCQAVEVDNTSSRAYFLLGKLHTRNKEYAPAIDAYQKAGSLNPAFPDSFFNLGFLYATTGMYENAEQFFQRAVELNPDYLSKALFNLAVIQERLGKYETSLGNLRRASELDPENLKVQNYLQGAIAKKEGQQ